MSKFKELEPKYDTYPDLQDFVRAAGGWDKLTASDWARFDHDRRIYVDKMCLGMLRKPRKAAVEDRIFQKYFG